MREREKEYLTSIGTSAIAATCIPYDLGHEPGVSRYKNVICPLYNPSIHPSIKQINEQKERVCEKKECYFPFSFSFVSCFRMAHVFFVVLGSLLLFFFASHVT
jgi:hypothetical protein